MKQEILLGDCLEANNILNNLYINKLQSYLKLV